MVERKITKKVKVSFDSTRQIKEFVGILENNPVSAEFITSNQKVDATSLMGIFTLDVTAPIDLKLHTSTDDEMNAVLNAISKFTK